MSLLVYAQPGFNSETGAYRVTILQDPRSHKIQSQPAIFKAQSILSQSFCVRLHDLHKRIQTFEGCILNVWKCIYIMKQFKCGLIFPYLLSKGTGDKGALQKELFKPELQNYGVLSQCTIIHPGRFRRTCGNSFIYFLFVVVFLSLLSLHKWVNRW